MVPLCNSQNFKYFFDCTREHAADGATLIFRNCSSNGNESFYPGNRKNLVCHAYARTRESEIDAMIFMCHLMYFSGFFYGTVFVEFEQSSVIEFEIRA
jgi:hypothetical protein